MQSNLSYGDYHILNRLKFEKWMDNFYIPESLYMYVNRFEHQSCINAIGLEELKKTCRDRPVSKSPRLSRVRRFLDNEVITLCVGEGR